MKILIVGGAGYVGGYLTDLLSINHDVTVYDNLLYETRYLKKVNFINGDVRDHNKLGKIINDYEVVIWLAAIVGDGACAVNLQLTQTINTDCVKWLVDNYRGKIVFTSTCSVYGANDNLIDEEAVTNPLSMYASTKLEAERYIVDNHPNHLIFRLGTLYGLSDEHSRVRLDLVANILVKRSVEGETLLVFGGEQWRPLLHVKDVSHAIDYCLSNDINGLYVLSERNVIISELAKEIQSCIPGTKIVEQDLKFEDMRNYKVKNDKILSTGWRPKFTLKDGIYELKGIFEEKRIKEVNDRVYSNADFIKYINSSSNRLNTYFIEQS